MKLTDIKVRNASFSGTSEKLFDGNGLYLLVNNSGKYWRYDYRYLNKRKTYSYGVYPEVSLKMARDLHVDVKALLRAGTDPNQAKKQGKIQGMLDSENTFRVVAEEYLETKTNWADSHRIKVIGRLKKDIYPTLGNLPISQISAKEVLVALRRVESRGAIESAHRLKQTVGQIFQFGVATGRCEVDPTFFLKGALKSIVKSNYPVPKIHEVGTLLRAIDGFKRNDLLRMALQLGAYTFLRSSELLGAKWDEIHFESACWVIPANRMKAKREHTVYLSNQAISLLIELRDLPTSGPLIFPGFRSNRRPINGATVNNVFRELGFTKQEVVFHSFRGIFSTIANERLEANPDVIEQLLAHKPKDKIRAAYNRAEYREAKTELMQEYADYLDGLREENPDTKQKYMQR